MAATRHRAPAIPCMHVVVLLEQCRRFCLDRLLDDPPGIALDSLSRLPTSPLCRCFIDAVKSRVDGRFPLDGSDTATLVSLPLRSLPSNPCASVHVLESTNASRKRSLVRKVTKADSINRRPSAVAYAELVWSLLKRNVSVRSRTFDMGALACANANRRDA